MRSRNIPYNPAIDHLRGAAALLIVYYHAHEFLLPQIQGAPYVWPRAGLFYALLVEGHTAVGLFMVLSGFIFTAAAFGRKVCYLPFLFNRILRIYPLMLAILMLALALHPNAFRLWPFISALLFPLQIPGPLNFVVPLSIVPWTAIFWTLTPEFQFYLLFPFLLWAVHRYGARVLIVFVAMALSARIALSQEFDLFGPTYSTIIGRIDEFLIGMGAAVVWRQSCIAGNRPGKFILIAIAAVLVILWAYNRAGGWEEHAPWKLVWPTAEGTMWAAFILCYLDFATSLPKSLSYVLVAIGECSFSIYLLHWPIESLSYRQAASFLTPLAVLHLGAVPNVLIVTTLFFVPLVLLVSQITYRLIERPFLSMRLRYLAGATDAKSAGLFLERPLLAFIRVTRGR